MQGLTPERVARNAALKAAVQATRVLSLLLVVLAARGLGPETFGRFTFAYSLAALLGAALDLGMHALLTREVARDPAATGRHWSRAATLKLALLVPGGLVLAAVPLLTGRPAETTGAVWLLGLAIVLQSFIELAVAVCTGFERLEIELRLRITEKCGLFALGAGGLLLGGGLWVVCGAFTAAAAGSLGLATALVHRRLVPLRWGWDARGAWRLARTLGPVAVAFVCAFATTRLVPLVVAVMAGDLAAGHLGAGLRVLDVVGVMPVALGAAVFPVLARTPVNDVRFRRAAVESADALLLAALAVGLGLTFGAATLVDLVYGPAYEPAVTLLTILGVAVAPGFLNYFFGFVLLALDRSVRLLVVAAVGLGASAVLAPVLVQAFGVVGGALALVLVEVLALAGHAVALAPFTGWPFGTGALKVAASAALALAVAPWLPAGSVRTGIALLVYGGALAALRPFPPGRLRQLLRGLSSAPADAQH